MSILDDLMINAKTAVDVVGKKAEMVIDSSKLKYAESGLQSEIHKKERELGSFVYKSYIAGEMDKDALAKMVQELRELNESLESTRELKNLRKNKHTCPTCGALVSADLSYCGKCGAKLVSAADKEAQQAVKDAEDEILGD